jgi:multidrug efflux pump subunit AcrB
VLIIAMMCLGLLALKKLRVNQNPDVEVPIHRGQHSVSGRVAGNGRARDRQPPRKALQSITGVTEINSHGQRKAAPASSCKFDFKRNLIEASDDVRNAIAAVRYKLPTEMREPVLQRIDPSAQPIMNWRCRRAPRATRKSRAWPKTCWPTASAPSTAWPT